jgi:hypothetical protein
LTEEPRIFGDLQEGAGGVAGDGGTLKDGDEDACSGLASEGLGSGVGGGHEDGGIGFTAETPGPSIAGLGIVQQGKFVDGKWTVVRQLGGDDIGQGEILALRPNTILRVVLYRYE